MDIGTFNFYHHGGREMGRSVHVERRKSFGKSFHKQRLARHIEITGFILPPRIIRAIEESSVLSNNVTVAQLRKAASTLDCELWVAVKGLLTEETTIDYVFRHEGGRIELIPRVPEYMPVAASLLAIA